MEERLTALRETCLAKCRKCEEVEKEVEKEQQTNIEIRNAIPLASKASALRLQLATRQHQKNCDIAIGRFAQTFGITRFENGYHRCSA